ncbi:hypothetical protein HDU91_004014 [Kappamyces sp. JEL0680]|nr:hypothetical protein HDU91_004014 [Kappamyces sp. JEL0680]
MEESSERLERERTLFAVTQSDGNSDTATATTEEPKVPEIFNSVSESTERLEQPGWELEGRRASVELRLSKLMKTARTARSVTISTTSPPVRSEPLSPVNSMLLDLADASLGSKGIDVPRGEAMPIETNLVYGSEHDAHALMKDMENIKDDEPGTTPNPGSGIPLVSSAVSWLSKNSSLDEPKYHLVTPQGDSIDIASTKKNSEFHDLFPDLDQNEKLIDDYTCAWLNDVLLHGRMYITERNMCFHSKVIWTYTITLPLADIVLIERKVVGGLFDNALEVSSADKKVLGLCSLQYYFTSFLFRNQAHDVMAKVIAGLPDNIIELKPLSPLEITHRHSSRSSSINEGRRSKSMGSMDETRSLLSLKPVEDKKMGLAEIVSPIASAVSIVTGQAKVESPAASPAATTPSSSLSKKHIVHQKHKVTAPTPAQLAQHSPKTTSFPPKTLPVLPSKPFECTCSSLHEQQKGCLDQVVALTVEDAWKHLYSYTSLHSQFCNRLWQDLGYTGRE